ncbi:MAG TPA: rRNA (guanine-N1)-methyltransferase [Nakamurella sp.]|nr:rRNA (guanine-N1)-methyltransferase [Nakamurella sp.]
MIRPGLAGVLPLLACPSCGGVLTEIGESGAGDVVGCAAGHRFDVARQGYLSLLGPRSRTDTGDTADMVAAREQFLGAGHYRQIARAVADRVVAGPVIEVGAGTGYYLATAVDRLTSTDSASAAATRPIVGLALDSSRYAARRAAALHPRVGSVVADAWSGLPVLTGVAGTVLSVFAPRNADEITRVLAPGGRLVVVTPQPAHLAEIRGPLRMLTVDEGKPERLEAAFAGRLRVLERADLRAELRVSRSDAGALVRMGPSIRHIDAADLAANLAGLGDVTAVTMAVTISVLER